MGCPNFRFPLSVQYVCVCVCPYTYIYCTGIVTMLDFRLCHRAVQFIFKSKLGYFIKTGKISHREVQGGKVSTKAAGGSTKLILGCIFYRVPHNKLVSTPGRPRKPEWKQSPSSTSTHRCFIRREGEGFVFFPKTYKIASQFPCGKMQSNDMIDHYISYVQPNTVCISSLT